MSKKTAPTTTTAVSTLSIVQAMLTDLDGADDLRAALASAERRLPDLVGSEAGFSACEVQRVAGLVSTDVHGARWTAPAGRVERIMLGAVRTIDNDDVSAVSEVGYTTAGSAFALGLVAGLRLAGGGR